MTRRWGRSLLSCWGSQRSQLPSPVEGSPGDLHRAKLFEETPPFVTEAQILGFAHSLTNRVAWCLPLFSTWCQVIGIWSSERDTLCQSMVHKAGALLTDIQRAPLPQRILQFHLPAGRWRAKGEGGHLC